jgi:hypothetical protein
VKKVLVTTIPKSGTHLLMQILPKQKWVGGINLRRLGWPGLIPQGGVVVDNEEVDFPPDFVHLLEKRLNSEQQVYIGHFAYLEPAAKLLADRNVHILQLVRDPRDVVVSHCHTVCEKDKRLLGHDVLDFKFANGTMLSEQADPLEWCIRVAPYWWEGWLPWLPLADIVVRFEDLVGPDQRTEVERIATLVPGMDVGESMARIDPLKSKSFRKGLVGEWRTEFKSHHAVLFDELMGDVMNKLGYS